MILNYSGVEESVEHCPDLINLKNEEGKTPLHLTILSNHFHLASYLMERVCNLHVISS